MKYEIKTVNVLGSEMEIFCFSPSDGMDNQKNPVPGIILVQHIPVGHTGLENDIFTLHTAQRLADNGFFVAVPFIFHWWPKSEDIQVKRSHSRDDWLEADLEAAWNLLKSDPKVGSIGIVGHCWGGRGAWLGACCLREIGACAMFYGGRIQLSMGEGATPPINRADEISCPVIGFYGDEDKSPSPEDVDLYAKALDQAGIDYDFHCYEGAGHAFQNFPSPERYNEEASEDAWSKLLVFLTRNLQTNADISS